MRPLSLPDLRAIVLLTSITFARAIVAAGGEGADVASEARFFDAVARRHYQKGEYEQALEAFLLVHEIAPSPRLLYNVAMSADLAGRADMAFSLLQEYLRSGDEDAGRRAEGQRRAERLRSKLALIDVQSDPPGAAIYVDRKELGQFGRTPVTVALSPGEHRLFVERGGFVATEIPVTAKTGATAPASVKLDPLFGSVTVHVSPPTAKLQFSCDGAPVPARAEHGSYTVPVGQYRIVASASGYAPAEATVAVREAAVASIDLGLVPLPRATGTLLVGAHGVTADVFLDGRRVAITPATLPGVGEGDHVLEVRARSGVVRRRVVITKGRANHVEVDLGGGAR